MTLWKGMNETLHNYNKRYWELYNDIKGCLEELTMVSYKLRLIPSKKLWDDLTLNPQLTSKTSFLGWTCTLG